MECGGPNVVWFAPNDLWNRVMRGGDRGAPDVLGIVCPVCFIRRAEALGVKPTGWSVQGEFIPPDPPVAVPGPASERDSSASASVSPAEPPAEPPPTLQFIDPPETTYERTGSRPADPVVSPADTIKRYEIGVLIGPCAEAECEALMGAILDLPEATAVGGVVSCGPWTGELTRRELLAVGERDKAEIEGLKAELALARDRAVCSGCGSDVGESGVCPYPDCDDGEMIPASDLPVALRNRCDSIQEDRAEWRSDWEALRAEAKALEVAGERDRRHIARLTEALERIADHGCRVRYGGRRRDWTCLDQQRDAIERPEGYTGNDYWRELKAGDHLCDACRARAVLADEEDATPGWFGLWNRAAGEGDT